MFSGEFSHSWAPVVHAMNIIYIFINVATFISQGAYLLWITFSDFFLHWPTFYTEARRVSRSTQLGIHNHTTLHLAKSQTQAQVPAA